MPRNQRHVAPSASPQRPQVPTLAEIRHQDVRCPFCKATVIIIPDADDAEPAPPDPCPHTAVILVSAAGGEPEMIRPAIARWWQQVQRTGDALGSGAGQVDPAAQKALRFCPHLDHLIEMQQDVGPASSWLVSVGFSARQ